MRRKRTFRRGRRRGEAGFTLVEILVVITIIGLIMGLVGPRVLNYLGESKVKAAHIQIQSFASALDLFYLDNGRYPYAEAELYWLRGDLLSAAGSRDGAEHNYHQALAVAKRQSARLLELCAAIRLARLWRDQGKRTEARDLLAPIYNWFTEGLDAPVLKEAKALLDQLA
jgi:prepilin-type N-terminal cleavage/methylation domain-containing protein